MFMFLSVALYLCIFVSLYLCIFVALYLCSFVAVLFFCVYFFAVFILRELVNSILGIYQTFVKKVNILV